MAEAGLIAVVISSAAGVASPVASALAQRIILRARRDLVQVVAGLPPGTEISEQGRAGSWQARTVAKPGHK